MGTVSSIQHDAGGCTLTISDSAPILGDCHIGDSISVNGACLTVTQFHPEAAHGYLLNQDFQNAIVRPQELWNTPRKLTKAISAPGSINAHYAAAVRFCLLFM